MFNRESVNLESHQLIWLDSNSNEQNSPANKKISLDDLRKIIDYTNCFYNVEECFDYMNKTQDCKTLLVCTDESIVNAISNNQRPRNLLGIYVLCENEKDHPKNIRTYTNSDDLLKDLSLIANNKSILIEFTTDDLYRTWWADFIDILCYITYPADSLSKLVTALKEYYKENASEMGKLTRFELEYKSDNPIFWYTQDTCIYRVLNTALRQHNIELLFPFGFYVQDLFRQLTTEHERFRSVADSDNFKIRMYRSQLISKSEIKLLKDRLGLSIITNSLFSTTFNRQFALFLLESSLSAQLDNDLQSVLFEIQVDLRVTSRPYAEISRLSHFPEESEVLFAIGTEFDVIDVNFAENIWTFDLRLSSDSFKFKKELNHLTRRRCFITSVDKLIHTFKSPSLDEIESIFSGLQRLLPSEKWILAAKYYSQAEYQRRNTKNCEIASSAYDQAINTWLEYNSNNSDAELNCWFHIGHIYESIGSFCYETTKDKVLTKNIYMMALNNYKKAMNLEMVDDIERIEILSRLATTYKSIASMCNDDDDDDDEKSQIYLHTIEYYKLCLNSMLECYSPNNIEFADYYKKIADVYQILKDYDKAIDNYVKALDVQAQNIGSASSLIISLCTQIIGIDYMLRRNYERQLKYQLIKHEYILKDRNENVKHSDGTFYYKKELGESHAALAYIYLRLGQNELGKNHHQQTTDIRRSIGLLDSPEIKIIESIEILE